MYLDYNWMMQLIPNNSAKICHHSAAAIDSLKNSLMHVFSKLHPNYKLVNFSISQN